jgi:hypothetical protein
LFHIIAVLFLFYDLTKKNYLLFFFNFVSAAAADFEPCKIDRSHLHLIERKSAASSKPEAAKFKKKISLFLVCAVNILLLFYLILLFVFLFLVYFYNFFCGIFACYRVRVKHGFLF